MPPNTIIDYRVLCHTDSTFPASPLSICGRTQDLIRHKLDVPWRMKQVHLQPRPRCLRPQQPCVANQDITEAQDAVRPQCRHGERRQVLILKRLNRRQDMWPCVQQLLKDNSSLPWKESPRSESHGAYIHRNVLN